MQPQVMITTPFGVFDSEFDERGLPPTVLKLTPVEEVGEDVSITGMVILTKPFNLGSRLNLVIPDDYAQPLSQVRALRQCRPGDQVQFVENMTDLGVTRTYTAVVLEADGGVWVGVDEEGEQYFSVVMLFRVVAY